MKNILKRLKMKDELELVLLYFSGHIQKAQTKQEARNELDTATYVLKLIIEKYYE